MRVQKGTDRKVMNTKQGNGRYESAKRRGTGIKLTNTKEGKGRCEGKKEQLESYGTESKEREDNYENANRNRQKVHE